MSDLKPVQKLVYKIIVAEDVESLAVAVTKEIKLGWWPQGGVHVWYTPNYSTQCLQAMLKR